MKRGISLRWVVGVICWAGAGLIPALAQNCIDQGASDPNNIRIKVTILSAKGSASIDGDNILFDNEADLRPEVSINGGPWMLGDRIDGDDTPHFMQEFEVEIPRALRVVPIRIRMNDRDYPDESDSIDLDPEGGCDQDIDEDDLDCSLELFFDTCCLTFSGDGTTGAPSCPEGDCAGGGDGHWLGPGDHGEHAAVRVAIQTGDGFPVCSEGDVFVSSVEFVQVVDKPGFAVAGRGSILRVTVGSTFPGPVATSVEAFIGDSVGPDVTAEIPVDLDHCGTAIQTFFVDEPVVVDFSRAHYGARIDPDGILPYTDPCARVNDGEGTANNIEIRTTRDLSVVYQRIYYKSDCLLTENCDWVLTDAEANAEATDADIRIRGFFPAPELTSFVDPIALSLPAPDLVLGPRSEIQVLSEAAALLGLDRVAGLVPFNFVDAHAYVTVPLGTVGVSNGKIGPHFILAESLPGEEGFTPVHELGHTFGLSDEPCSVGDINVFELYLCEDEYNASYFPGRPDGGFQGKGFDVPRGMEAAGTCFMDSDREAWISNNDFESFVGKMEPGRDPRVLVVTGHVTNAGGGELLAAVGLEEGILDRSGPADSPFSLVLKNSAGVSLGQFGIYTDMRGEDINGNDILDDGELFGDADDNGVPDWLPVPHPSERDEDLDGIADAAERAEFALRIPWLQDTARVDLVGPGGAVIDTLLVGSGSPPQINLLDPLGDIRLDPACPQDLFIPVRWNLTPTAGLTGKEPPITSNAVQGVTIAASYDGGQTWLPKAHRVNGDFVIDAHGISSPLVMKIRVMALVNGPAGTASSAPDTDGDHCPDPIDPHPTTPDETTDTDHDGIPDICDRCLGKPDPLQTDQDQDGYGDRCDGDYDQDGLVGPPDLPLFETCLGEIITASPSCYDRDFDGDGVVTDIDRDSFFYPLLESGKPGPSALVPDGDTDGVGDAYDCAPTNSNAWKAPAPVTGLRVSPSSLGSDHVQLSWDSQAGASGPSTVYDVLTGTLADLLASGGFTSSSCLVADHPESSVDPRLLLPGPPLPNGWWLLVRGENPCGRGTVLDGTETPGPRALLDTVACLPPTPLLSIIKLESADPVPAGGRITYTLSYRNDGAGAATDVVITDPLPSGTTFDSASHGGYYDPTLPAVVWNLGTLEASESGWVTMTVIAPNAITAPTLITNANYTIDSAETEPVTGNPVTTTVLPPPRVAIDLDPSTPTTIESTRKLTPTVSTLDVGVVVDATGTAGFGDIPRIAFGVINSFNPGGATVTSITPLSINDLMPPATTPYNAHFASLAGEFQFGSALVERGVPSSGFSGGPVQYATFRLTFGTHPSGSQVRVFIGDKGPGNGWVLARTSWSDISGDASPDGTPVFQVPGSDQGVAAGIHYGDATILFLMGED